MLAAFDCEDVLSFAKWSMAVLLLAHLSRGIAAAQSDPQAVPLSGVVIGQSGSPLADAVITVYRDGTAIAHLRTDAAGTFAFSSWPREYKVEIQAPDGARVSSVIPFAEGSSSRFYVTAPSEQCVATGPNCGSCGLQACQPGERHNSQETAWEHFKRMPWNYGVLFQGGFGLTEDRDGFKFLLAGAHLGKVLTPELGTGPLRGDFEYAVELFPYWQSFTPKFSRINCVLTPNPAVGELCSPPYTVGGTFTGVSVTPIILRWNFTHSERWMPWIQGAGGVVWTNHKYPAYGDTNPQDLNETGADSDTSVWNFTPQFGVGTHIFLEPKRSLDISANAVHISSASLGDRNPGVNASVQLSVGYTWWK